MNTNLNLEPFMGFCNIFHTVNDEEQPIDMDRPDLCCIDLLIDMCRLRLSELNGRNCVGIRHDIVLTDTAPSRPVLLKHQIKVEKQLLEYGEKLLVSSVLPGSIDEPISPREYTEEASVCLDEDGISTELDDLALREYVNQWVAVRKINLSIPKNTMQYFESYHEDIINTFKESLNPFEKHDKIPTHEIEEVRSTLILAIATGNDYLICNDLNIFQPITLDWVNIQPMF